MSLIDTPYSVLLLRRCETGCVKNITRYKLSFLNRLIQSDEFYFQEIFKYSQRGKIIQKNDKVFFHSARDAHSVYSDRIDPERCLYSLKKFVGSTRLNEAKMLVYKNPLCKSVLTPRNKFRPTLLIVTDDNRLLHLDFDNGQLLDSIFLGSLKRCKFSYIQWESYPRTITIGSTESKHKKTKLPFSYVILMSIMPLKFIACIKIDSKTFERQNSPHLSDGMLIVRDKCPFPDKKINVYSIEHLLTANNFLGRPDIDQRCNIPDCSECARTGDRTVGREDHGLPVNVEVKEVPPILMTIKSSYELLEYGSWPFHLIYSPPGRRDTYVVERLSDRTPIDNGEIMYDNFIEDDQKLMFHYDSMDGRVLGLDCHTLTFFRIENNQLCECFVLSCTPDWFLKSLQHRLITCKKARKNDNMYKSIFSHVNDPETDIYCLMGVDLSSSKLDQPVICLFDNTTGRRLKKFKLNFQIEETNDYDLTLDRDLILINETTHNNYNRFFCYRLTRKQPVDL